MFSSLFVLISVTQTAYSDFWAEPELLKYSREAAREGKLCEDMKRDYGESFSTLYETWNDADTRLTGYMILCLMSEMERK